jgi:hypothetical protein
MKVLISALFLLVFISCEKDELTELDYTDDTMIPSLVCVKIKDNYPINKAFWFINSFNFDVDHISNRIYKSSLPPDSLDYIVDYISQKPYSNDGKNKWFLSYIDYKTNMVHILPSLYHMRIKNYQFDWLHTMSVLRLSEVTGSETGQSIITFHVPAGHEKECAEKFGKYKIVQWARSYHKIQINPNP